MPVHLPPAVLTINGGSSSIRFAVYDLVPEPRCRQSGMIDRIGLGGSAFSVDNAKGSPEVRRRLAAPPPAS